MNDPQIALELTVEAVAPLPTGVDEASLESLVRHALRAEGQNGPWEISLQFTTDDIIQAMHLEFMGLDSPTDIMTFPYEEEAFPGIEPGARGGDIVMSVDTAKDNAAEAGWTLRDELEFLVLHGVLHILGWDDGTDDDRARMLARQSVLLEEWRATA